ncbi:MAG: alpha-2-macroglobulin [Acidobacteriota bacterium]|nr:alpha-2-macroglobulin [Acidobacteriota bacterium]
MKRKIFITILIVWALLSVALYFNNNRPTGSNGSKGSNPGLSGSLMFARGSAQETKSPADIPAKKWQQMIATDINALQKGSKTTQKDQGATVYAAAIHPQGETRDIGETDEISITFSEPVSPLKKIDKTETTLIQTLPYLKGEGYWKSSTTYCYRIDQPRKLSTKYNVRFKGYTAFTGKIAEKKEWTFTTPTVSLTHSKPYERAKWQTLDQLVLVEFSQDVDPEQISKFISIVTPNGSPTFSVRYCTKEERKLLYYYTEDNRYAKRCVTISPNEPYPQAADIQVKFLAGLPALEGNVGMTSERVVGFRTYEIFRILKVDNAFAPDKGFEIEFSNPVQLKHLFNRISFSPPVTIDKSGDWNSHYITVMGKFVPNTTYTLTVPADLRDQFVNKLGADKKYTIKCLDYDPFLAPPNYTHFVLENYLDLDIPIEVINVFETPVYYRSLEVQDLRDLYHEDWSGLNPHKMDVSTCSHYKWNIPVKKNIGAVLGFNLNLIGANNPGYYYINFANATSEYNADHVFQLTNVAMVAKYSPTQIFLVPFNMKTGDLVPNLTFKIENFNPKNSIGLGEVKANKDGVGIFQPPTSVLENNNLQDCFVFSEPNKSFIWGKKSEMLEMWNFTYRGNVNYNYEPQYLYNHLLAFTDKHLYKGGQTVKFKGIVRQVLGGPMQIPNVKQIGVEVFDSRGQSINKLELPGAKVTSHGSFADEFTLPQDTPTGFYRIDFNVQLDKSTFKKSVNFSVQEYKPSKFEVKLAFDQQSLISGQAFSGTVNGRYLFGTPMKQAQGNCTWTTEYTYFTPEGWDGYSFGSYESTSRETIYQEDITLDDEGNFKFERDPLTVSGKNSVSLSVYGEVQDKDNNRIATSKSMILHRGQYYIGVKSGSYFFQEGKPGKLQVVTVSPEGKAFKNTTLDMKITREEWKSFQQKDVSGALRWEWKKSVEDVLKETISLSNGAFEKEYKFDKPGYYIVELQGEDKLKNTITTSGYFYVTGSGYISWGVNEGRTIDIVTDKLKYKPGENIEVLIKSPFEKSTALITVEREKVMWSKVVRLQGNAGTIQVPVLKEFMPNAYINVIILKERSAVTFDEQGNDTGKPEFYAGYKQVDIDAGEMKLNVEITANQASYEPGNDVQLDILVKDPKGAPVKAELCISVVDKGVLNLVGYQLPNPFDFFWANRPLDVRTVSTLNDVLGRRKYGEKGENQGGDGGGSVFGSVVVRKEFKESAYYTAFIVTDNKGKAKVSFKLPDNLTTFKAMAVGGTVNNLFGSGSKDILVKKNLILKPALPDFSRPMDAFSAGVTVTNNSDKSLKVAVQVSCENIQREKGDPDIKKINLNPGETQPVWYRFNVTSTAPAKLTFKAVADRFTDGLYEEIPVRVPQFTEAAANFGRVETAPVTEQIIVPTGTLRSLDKVEITLASSAMVGVKRNFDLLQEYPYDCLEQRISKQYPLVGAGEFLLTYKLLDMSKQDIDKRIEDLLKIMPQYQDGGFKYYPECIFPCPYLTCYAVEFILDARAKGYYIDPKMLRDAEEYLKGVANRTINSKYPYSNNVWFLVQSYAVYALSKDNIFMKDAINNLFEVRDRIPFAGLAYLVKALDLKNDLPPYMQPVLAKTLINKMKDEPTMTHFENIEDNTWWWIHESNVKTTANVLETFLTVYGKFPYAEKIARWLTTTTNQKRWLSTQDHIRLFMAFEKYYRVFEKDTPNFVAEVLFNGLPKAKENFSSRELTARTSEVMLSGYKANDKIEATFKKEGTGMLYYLLRLKYYPMGEVEAIDRGFKVEKVYKKLDGKEVKDNVFKPGEKYIVEVTVNTNMEHPFVMLDDPIPAGLKVVNPNFQTGSQLDLEKTTRDNEWDAYWGNFYRSEVYFDRVQVFADYLSRGKHVWKYLVIATNEGTYAVPNTVVCEMYNFEVFGRNDNRSVQVK